MKEDEPSTDRTSALVPTGYENEHSHDLTPAVFTLPADRHPAAVYLASLRAGSRRSTHQALAVVAAVLKLELELVPWQAFRYQHTQAVRAALADRYAPSTANKILAALRGVLRSARRLGLMSAEHEAAAADLESMRGANAQRGRALVEDELLQLRSTCDPSSSLGARDVAMLAVLYGGGLRRSEAVGLDLEDLPDAGAGELLVHGKGHKVRTVFLGSQHAADVVAWLERRGRARGPLLCPVLKGGRIVLRRLNDQTVLVALRRLAKRAGVADFSPHDLRRTYISALLDRGADISTVARLAGHSQVTTTARYDRRGDRAMRSAAELLTTL